MSLKIGTKNFSADEIALLVDLIQEEKQNLFCAFSSSLTCEEKNSIWENIVRIESITKHLLGNLEIE